MLLVLDVLLVVFYYSVLRDFSVYLPLYSMYVTMSISIGLYPNLDLWNANILHYMCMGRSKTTKLKLSCTIMTINSGDDVLDKLVGEYNCTRSTRH